MKLHSTPRAAGAALALMLTLASKAAVAQSYDGVISAIDTGNYPLALSRLDPLVRVGCRGRAHFLLGVVKSKLEDAVATARAADRALRCNAPVLDQRFRDDALRLLRWASRNTAVRFERIKYELSDDSETTDVSLMTAEREQLTQVEQARDEVLALAELHIPGIRGELLALNAANVRETGPEQANHQIMCAIDPDETCPELEVAPKVTITDEGMR